MAAGATEIDRLLHSLCSRLFRTLSQQGQVLMTFNEINNQANYENDISVYENSGIKFKEGDDKQKLMYQAAHYEMVASAEAVQIGHAIDPDMQIGCMLAFCPIYPASPKQKTSSLPKEQWTLASTSATFKLTVNIQDGLLNTSKTKTTT